MSDQTATCECCEGTFSPGLDENPYCGPCSRARSRVEPDASTASIDRRWREVTGHDCAAAA